MMGLAAAFLSGVGSASGAPLWDVYTLLVRTGGIDSIARGVSTAQAVHYIGVYAGSSDVATLVRPAGARWPPLQGEHGAFRGPAFPAEIVQALGSVWDVYELLTRTGELYPIARRSTTEEAVHYVGTYTSSRGTAVLAVPAGSPRPAIRGRAGAYYGPRLPAEIARHLTPA